MKEDIVYICPQTKTQCDDECCVSAEDCHAEAINSIISNCEPEQLNKHKMKTENLTTRTMNKIERAIYDVKLHIADKQRQFQILRTQIVTLESELETLESIEKDGSIPYETKQQEQ